MFCLNNSTVLMYIIQIPTSFFTFISLYFHIHNIFFFSTFFLIDKANDCRKNEAEDVKIKQNNPFANVRKTKSIQFICDCTIINENVFVHG